MAKSDKVVAFRYGLTEPSKDVLHRLRAWRNKEKVRRRHSGKYWRDRENGMLDVLNEYPQQHHP